jgi:hypothetical protein
MRLYYLDESEGPTHYVRSGIGVNAEVWSEAFQLIQAWRKELRTTYQIPLFKELHASDLLAGRGELVRVGNKYRRVSRETGAKIFISGLQRLERIAQALSGGLEVINISLMKRQEVDVITLERLLNRIQRSVESQGRYAFLVFDQGKEGTITKTYKKALVYNPIPSKYGLWETGERWKNIPPRNIVGGPAFRSSKSDYFLQMADFIAHALLKKDEKPPIPRVAYYHIDEAFDQILDKALNLKASEDDPKGVVRY